MVKVDQKVSAVPSFGTGMGAAALPTAAGRIWCVFVEKLATVIGPFTRVRDHRRLRQMHAHRRTPSDDVSCLYGKQFHIDLRVLQ